MDIAFRLGVAVTALGAFIPGLARGFPIGHWP
jgi:hypothetical protein